MTRSTVLAIIVIAIVLGSLLVAGLQTQRQKQLNDTLVSSIGEGKVDEVKDLVRAGANVNYQPSRSGLGYTPLHWAIYEDNYQAAKFLLENGANPNIKDRRGQTPMDFLKEQNSEEAEELLKWFQASSNKLSSAENSER
jgi:ankyrin repeat protein